MRLTPSIVSVSSGDDLIKLGEKVLTGALGEARDRMVGKESSELYKLGDSDDLVCDVVFLLLLALSRSVKVISAGLSTFGKPIGDEIGVILVLTVAIEHTMRDHGGGESERTKNDGQLMESRMM